MIADKKPTRGQIVRERVFEALAIGLMVGICNAMFNTYQAVPQLQQAVATLKEGQANIAASVEKLSDRIAVIYLQHWPEGKQ